jgi:protein phosphatase
MQLSIPELALVVLVGPSGAGKSTFARAHFRPSEVVSADACRALIADDEQDQSVTPEAFDLLQTIARKRMAAGRLTVIDATSVQPEARRPFVALAREFHLLPVAVVFDLPERVCQERNRQRRDRDLPAHIIRRQLGDLHRSLRALPREGFRQIHTFTTPEQIADAWVVREPLPNNRKAERGPFDIVGDIHGCRSELEALLHTLGYAPRPEDGVYAHPANRKAIFLGDLVDRGPDSPGVLRIVMGMVQADTALCVPGNHDIKLMRKLRGRDVHISNGLAETLAQLHLEPPAFRTAVADFIDSLVSHYVLDGGRLVVAHAGMKQEFQGRGSARVREFALYGETTGETDEFGLPVRANWAAAYRGSATVVYGHTPVPQPVWLNRTINIDTGCVFGGPLSALRYPERELVSVPSLRAYAEPARPFLSTPDTPAFQVPSDLE